MFLVSELSIIYDDNDRLPKSFIRNVFLNCKLEVAESVKEETTAGIRQSGFSFIQKTIFQHTHNIHLQA